MAMIGMCSFATSCFWTAAIAHHLYSSVGLLLLGEKGEPEEEATLLFRYHVVCWGYPFLAAVIVIVVHHYDGLIVACGKYGIDCFGCFIGPHEMGYRLLMIYFPLWSSWCFVCIMYLLTYFKLRHLQLGGNDPVLIQNFRRRLLLIPFVYILIRIPESVFRIREYRLFYIDDLDFPQQVDDLTLIVLNWAQACINPSQGFFNFILFVLASPRFLHDIRRILGTYCQRLFRGWKLSQRFPSCCFCSCCTPTLLTSETNPISTLSGHGLQSNPSEECEIADSVNSSYKALRQ